MDSNLIDAEIAEIRRKKAAGYSDIAIMNELNIPRTTFYRYKKRMQEQMKEVVALQSKEAIMEDIELCATRLEDCLKECQRMLEAKRDGEDLLTPSQRRDYISLKEELGLNLLRVRHETPEILAKGIIVNGDSRNTKQETDSTTTETPEQQAG